METTKQLYYRNDSYIPLREELHGRIIEEALREACSNETEPYGTLIGGGSGSGKSSVIAKLLISGQEEEEEEGAGTVLIDCDKIKLQLPEYQSMIDSDDEVDVEAAAAYVHDESSDIAEKLLQACILSKRNFIYDGTMKNFVKYDAIIKKLKMSGYSVLAFAVDVPIDVALERIKIRAEAEKRHVNPEIAIESHLRFVQTFLRLKELFDEYTLFDNTGDEVEVIAYKDEDGTEHIVNPVRYQQFASKRKLMSESLHQFNDK
ncbi:zeta toxin family protein [Cytobacillus sp. FSL R5-0377]|uniref:zeta toxin family protein n=1 Tax=Cytobacillus sp. FSL R5-0377 TaxID=2954543 RepID=UPI0030F615A6|nr:zeta toxin family protein [Cytobacillus sp. AMY 15.2]